MWRPVSLAVCLAAFGSVPGAARAGVTLPAQAATGTVTLTVTLNGQGHVVSNPAGIDCPGTCTMQVPSPAPIGYALTLTATPGSGYGYYGWYNVTDPSSSTCTGLSASCAISSLTAPTTLRASFYHLPAPAGTGAGGPGKVVYADETDTAQSDIWMANPDGSNATDVTNNPNLWARTPALSPDGTKIAFAGELGADSNQDIYVVNTDGSGLTDVTSHFASQFPGIVRHFWHPSWSSDGTELTFQGENPPPKTLVNSNDVYVTNFSTLTRITNVEDVQWADWSPSGDKIAFTRNRPGGSDNGIWTVATDGSSPHKVLGESSAALNIADPVWSPDATKLVFTAVPQSLGAGCAGKIFTVNADGSNLTDLVSNAWDCEDRDPSWSPDGTQIAFVRGEYIYPDQTARERDVFVMDATAGDAVGLAAVTATSESGDRGEREPNWRIPPPPTVPGEPVNVTATAADSSAVVAWSPPASTGRSTITGYVVTPYVGGISEKATTVGNVTSTTIGGLVNGTAYTFTVAAVNAVGTGPESTASNAVTPKASQTISFAPLASKTYGDSDFVVSAAASSGLTVSFSAAGNCILSAATVHITGAGACTITASQAGTAAYNPAPDVSHSFAIANANQAITITAQAPSAAVYGTSFTVAASAPGGAVSFSSAGACSNSGSTFTMTSGSGACTVRYDQGGGANYNAASEVTETVTAEKANQTVAFGPLPDRTVGAGDFNVSATTSSGLPVSFAASGSCTVSGATIHLTGAGSCTVTASQPGDANYTAVASVARTFTAQAPQTPPRATCSVPYVVGKTLASARKKIAAAHCRVGTVRRATSKRVRAGRVVLQRPAAGTRLPAGTKIKLVLSRG